MAKRRKTRRKRYRGVEAYAEEATSHAKNAIVFASQGNCLPAFESQVWAERYLTRAQENRATGLKLNEAMETVSKGYRTVLGICVVGKK